MTNIEPGEPDSEELRRQRADTGINARLRARSSQWSRYRDGDDQVLTRFQPGGSFAPQVGQTFGRLSVIDPDRRLHGKRAAVVRCSCGAVKRIRVEHLRSGAIKSCGCLQSERMDYWQRFREADEAAAAMARDEALAIDADRYGNLGPPRR